MIVILIIPKSEWKIVGVCVVEIFLGREIHRCLWCRILSRLRLLESTALCGLLESTALRLIVLLLVAVVLRCLVSGTLIASLILLRCLVSALTSLVSSLWSVRIVLPSSCQLDIVRYYFRTVSFLAGLVCVIAGCDSSFNEYLCSLLNVLLGELCQSSPAHDVVPLCPFSPVAASVCEYFRCSNSEISHHAPAVQMPYLRRCGGIP